MVRNCLGFLPVAIGLVLPLQAEALTAMSQPVALNIHESRVDSVQPRNASDASLSRCEVWLSPWPDEEPLQVPVEIQLP